MTPSFPAREYRRAGIYAPDGCTCASERPFGERSGTFGDAKSVATLLDRLIQPGEIIETGNSSYRLKMRSRVRSRHTAVAGILTIAASQGFPRGRLGRIQLAPSPDHGVLVL
ncbi:MAG: ATP-binding protein [Steroidobacteraceae bacterium]